MNRLISCSLPISVEARIPPPESRAMEANPHVSLDNLLSIWYSTMASVSKLPAVEERQFSCNPSIIKSWSKSFRSSQKFHSKCKRSKTWIIRLWSLNVCIYDEISVNV